MRLTLPSHDHGSRLVMVDGRQVGFVVGEFWGWRAYLWPTADEWPDYRVPNQVYVRGLLRDLRAELRRRLDETGPWWDTKKEGA